MLTNLKTNIIINDLEFDGIRKIGFSESGSFIIDVYVENGYKYFTTIPISPIEFRKNVKTKTSFKDNGNYLTIKDDWGNIYNIYCERSIINSLIDDCKNNGIPEDK